MTGHHDLGNTGYIDSYSESFIVSPVAAAKSSALRLIWIPSRLIPSSLTIRMGPLQLPPHPPSTASL